MEETLLFSPNSQAAMVPDADGSVGHPGAEPPHDHLLLDLFTMPVVEPYAISEPFSTAGKINLNQRIVPFTHIKRETALHGALKGMEFTAIPNTASTHYRSHSAGAEYLSVREVDVERTLEEVAKVLDPAGSSGKGVFRSASEICEVFLIPKDRAETDVMNWSSPAAFWSRHQLTGDNSREAPYNYLYPLLTTKSNTYQVHYRVQTLQPLEKKSNYDPANDFTVTGEQRGSYLVERYLDSNDPRFSDDVDPDATPLEAFYKFRTLRHTRFTPGL